MRRALLVHHGLNFERTIPVYLSVNPTLFNNVDYNGDTCVVSVDVGCETQEWSYNEDDAWLLVTGASSPGDNASVSIHVAVNDTGSLRQGTVTFSSPDCDDVIVTINQLANPV
ncbi:hypothetical protein D4R42_01370 [bacterium]|nr:MAG: hypothetical protein D4R42_01370 [bacterium]